MSDIKLYINKNYLGALFHYGHFIHDFIIPIIYHINVNNANWTHIYLITTSPSINLGTFKILGEKILGIPITQIPLSKESEINLPVVKINDLGFGPYNPGLFKRILPYISKRLTIPESPYKVILIERGSSKILGNQPTGSERRSLENHEEIKNALTNRFGKLFKNVILENIEIEEQISLFMNAEIIIGQHGAGLCNIIWCNRPDTLIIEFPPYQVDTFKNMCIAKEFKYRRIDPVPELIINTCEVFRPALCSNQLSLINCISNKHIKELIQNKGVIPSIRGGLGNQIFILAAAYVTSKIKDCPLYILNSKWKNPHSTINYMDTLFKNFGDKNIQSLMINRGCNTSICNFLKQNKYKHCSQDNNTAFKPPLLKFNGLLMDGFFQNYKFIKPYQNEIRDLLIKGLDSNIENIKSRFDTEKSAFIHIRRGDYLSIPNLFGIPTMKYYKTCVEQILKNKSIQKIFILSNDLNFVDSKEYFKNPIFKIVDIKNELNALALMSLCKEGAIIANSTFSWWGAFLGAHEIASPVYVPKCWTYGRDTTELCPSEWIKV